jgi:hypothetical protein
MNTRNRTLNIGNQLKSAAIALNNAQSDPDINGLLVQFGFSPAKLGEGLGHYNAATAQVAQTTARRGESATATEQLRSARQAASRAYQDLAKTARALFIDNPGALASLGVNQRMPRQHGALLRAAQTLFNSAEYSVEIREALEAHGYTESKLSAERAKVTAFETALARQGERRGAAQQARADQTAALTTLRKWMARFRKIARVALGDRPKELEKLGIASLLTPTPAQREGWRKAVETRERKKAQQIVTQLPKAA